MTTVKEAIEHLEKHHDPNEQICQIIWCANDVKMQAEEMDLEISEEEISDVLYEMEHRHDANYGISWETIDYYLGDIKYQREKEEQNELDTETN
jgi:hypothetical protein